MDKTVLISQLKEQLSNGELDQAFDMLNQWLEKNEGYRALQNEALQAQAQYAKYRKETSMGILSDDQAKLRFNQSTHQLLQLIDTLEQPPGIASTKVKSSSNKVIPFVIISAILIIAAVAWWWYNGNQKPEPPVVTMDESCPQYDEQSIFNILLLPFVALDESQSKPHIAISNSLARLKDQYKIDCDIKTYALDKEDVNAYPTTNDDAGDLADGCDAQLVIWGTTENVSDNTIVQTRYKFLSGDPKLELNKLLLTEDSKLDTVSSISSISTNGILTAAIEESIKLLFGLLAHETGNQAIAVEILEELETEDSTATLVGGMVLAENYLALNDNEKALKAYDKVLELHPDYALARNNRGILNYVNGQYVEATEDLTVALEKNPTDARILTTRGDAYMKAEQYKEARDDFKKARRQSESDDKKVIDGKIKVLDSQIQKEETIKEEAEQNLRSNPNNVNALLQKAEASKKLGSYEESIRTSEKVLNNDPDNAKAYANLINIYRVKKDTHMINETLSRVQVSNTDLSKVKLLLPYKINERNSLLKERITVPRE